MFEAADEVLIGVMKRPKDFVLARDWGWYRIPQAHAPRQVISAAVVGFYFTSAMPQDKWSIPWYAEIRGYELVRRRDLLPDEADDPNADALYYKLQLGPLIRREPPIPSLRWRRITFIVTTWDRFAAAQEINDLYSSGSDGLYVTLKESGFFPEREYEIHEAGITYRVPLAVPCQQGTVAVGLEEASVPANVLVARTLEEVSAAVASLGGPLPPKA